MAVDSAGSKRLMTAKNDSLEIRGPSLYRLRLVDGRTGTVRKDPVVGPPVLLVQRML